MTKRDDIKKKIKKEEKMSSGEGQLGSGSVDDTVDIDESMKDVIGHDPNGQSLAEEIKASTDDQTSRQPHEDEEEQ